MKILLMLFCAAVLHGQEPFSGAAAVDQQMERAVHDGLIPGGVVLIGHDGRVVYQKAYGSRALIPHREPMTLDTIFDAASLTKVIATTPAIMRLFEQGQIRLNDPVTKYLPEFQGGHSDITIRNLMTHFSGLRPDLDLKPAWSGYETGIQRALTDKPTGPPGVRFVYSDIDFILLGEIVHRLTGKTLDEYTRDNFYEPLGMHETMFLPPASLRPRIAPTEINPATGQPLRGEVHDDTARYMGGVAGHAGVFTTAADLAKFAQMMLDAGQGNGVRLFSAATVQKFTTPQSPPDQPILRGLGWDIDSPYSSNRGELFPIGSYGHTGYTGTSLWIDPFSRSYVIILTNSVHPHRGHSVVSLAQPHSDHRRRVLRNYGAQRETYRIQRDHRRSGSAPRSGTEGRGAHRPGRSGRRQFRGITRQTDRPDHQPDRREPRRAEKCRPHARPRESK